MGSKAMSYEELKHFINEKMSLSHVYQPVAIKTLLTSDGTASLVDIASDVSTRDPSQIEYYVEKIKRYPKIVLTKHEVVNYKKGRFQLNGFQHLSEEQREELIALLAYSRYENPEANGDCKESAKTGSYALPVVVQALIDQ